MYRKHGCIVKKHGFFKKDLNFTMKTRFSIEENGIMYRKPGCIVKKHRFYKERLKYYNENEVFHRHKIVLCIENLVLLLKKKRFYQERLKFYNENEVFYRRKWYYVWKTRLYS